MIFERSKSSPLSSSTLDKFLLAAGHSKFNCAAMVELAPMSDIDFVFTDAHPSATLIKMMQHSGVECIVSA